MFKIKISAKCIFIFYPIILLLSFSFKTKAEDVDYLQPQTTFVLISDKPDNIENKSALLLSKWLKNIYQVQSGFDVVKEKFLKSTESDIIISIGKTKFSMAEGFDVLEPYSFSIKRNDQIISIEGATPMGTLLATNYFLDHECGVRFYLPGDLFASLPETKKVVLKKIISVTEIPFTKYLSSTGYRNTNEFNWAYNNGLLRKDWGSHQHSMNQRFYNDTIFKLFPEIFPIVNGKRYFPQSKRDQQWEPDFAEPKLVDAAVYASIKYFKQNPQMDYISFSVMDSKEYPSEGKIGDFLKTYPDTKKGKYRGYTDAYILFLNKLSDRLKEELPANGITGHKTIVYLVYGNVHLVPDEKLNSDILPVTVYHIAESIMDSLFKDGGIFNKWSKVTNRIGNQDWAEGKGFIYPRIYTHLVSTFLRTIQKNHLNFDFAHLEIYPNWALDGPKAYLMSKIYWNPAADPDSLLSLFCSDMFGKASELMKAYFLSLENLNSSMNNNPQQNRRIELYRTQLPLNEHELSLVQQARQSIDKAYSVAQTDDQRKRIALFSKGFKISESFFEIYNAKTLDMGKVERLKEYLKNTVAGDKMMLNIAGTSDFLSRMNTVIDGIVKLRSSSSKAGRHGQ